MKVFFNFLIFIGKCIYTTLPAIIANMAPLFVKKINILSYPIDFGKTIKNRPIFGPKKTYRGLVAGIVFAMIIFYIQYLVYKYTNLKNLSLIPFDTVNIHLLGFLMGFGVMIGDLSESFVKRRLNFPTSKSFIPWDQLDCVIGGLIFVRIGWSYSANYAVAIIILTFFIHVGGRHGGYYLGFCESKW